MPYSSRCKRFSGLEAEFSGLEAEIDGNLWYNVVTY